VAGSGHVRLEDGWKVGGVHVVLSAPGPVAPMVTEMSIDGVERRKICLEGYCGGGPSVEALGAVGESRTVGGRGDCSCGIEREQA